MQVMGEQGVLEPAQGGLMETPGSTRYVGKTKFSLETCVFNGMFDFPPPLPSPHPTPSASAIQIQEMECGDTETPCGAFAVLQLCSSGGQMVQMCSYTMTPEMSLVLRFEPLLSLSLTRCPSVNTLMSGHLKAPGSPAGPRTLINVCLCFVGAIFTHRGCSSFLIVSHEIGCQHCRNQR